MYSSYHRSGRNGLGGGYYGDMNPAVSSSTTSSSRATSKRRRKMFAAVYGTLGLLAVYTNVLDMRLPTSFRDLRRQLWRTNAGCITNVYPTDYTEVFSLPLIPPHTTTYLPSYIKLCYEWMRREATPFPTNPYTNLNVLENQDICVDWSAPHFALMEIVASQILSAAIPVSGISYSHQCAEFRSKDEALLGFDWTPIQTIYQEASLGLDADAWCELHTIVFILYMFMLCSFNLCM